MMQPDSLAPLRPTAARFSHRLTRFGGASFLAWIACFFLTLGCSPRGVPATSIASSEAKLDQARELTASGNHGEALPLLNESIQGKSLNADQYVEALLLRAQCHALGGTTELAEKDIAEAEQGAPSEAMLEFTRGILFHAQGKSKESNAAFSKAQRLDPKLRKPSWLP